jgi:hypothetical protein
MKIIFNKKIKHRIFKINLLELEEHVHVFINM